MKKRLFKFTKPIRTITLFSGYDSQNLALKYLGIDHEIWKTCEWAIKSIQALKDLHFSSDDTDYSKNLDFLEIVDWLFQKGISSNYNEPMKRESIKRLGEQKCRQIYNNIKATHNMVNIQQVTAKDLQLEDNYEYLMTYSFPCQDLSLAGLGKGMDKNSGTRSGMLWEVERILFDIKNNNYQLPQVLLMENVPQVHGKKNKENFEQWIESLKNFGYSNYWKDLNAKAIKVLARQLFNQK